MKSLFATLALTVVFFASNAQGNAALRRKEFNLEKSLAIQGYDPVAYFKQGEAAKGKKEFSLQHEGVTYLFSSADNREAFKNNPPAYEPQYGGWCAYAMGAKGEKVGIDPETFKIVNNKLYLFYNRYFNNTLKSWNKDESNLKTKADQHWAKLFH
jgi:YHS domain-containing protein